MKRIVLFLAALICLCGCSKNQEPEQGEFDAMLLLGTWEELWPMEVSTRVYLYEQNPFIMLQAVSDSRQKLSQMKLTMQHSEVKLHQ